MTLISDTLNYRPDGTISAITRVKRDSFTTPSGRDATEDVSSIVTLDDVSAVLGPAYAGFDAHNKTLEEQIVTERQSAADDKQAALAALDASHRMVMAQLTSEHATALQAATAERNQAVADLSARLAATEAERDAAIAAAAVPA